MLNLGSTDAVRQRAKGAVGGGVRVAAHHGHARQGGALFGAHHMHDALPGIVHFEFEDAEVVAVFVQGFHLQTRHFVNDGL